MDNRGIDLDPGWVNRKIHDLERAIEALRSERRAAATTVSEGDFVVSGGGSVIVRDGGDVAVLDGVGDPAVSMADGDIVVEGGGRVVVKDGGGIDTEHDNGAGALHLGALITGGGNPAQGITLRDPNSVLYLAAYSDDVNGERVVLVGAAGFPVKLFQVVSESTIVQATTGDITLSVTAGHRVFIGHETTAAAANCFINTDGSIWRSTSSRRYKQDEEPIDVDPAAVLGLVGKTFRDRAEVEADPDTTRRYVGFTAEDLHDAGLTDFVIYDDQGRPDAILYDRLSVALLALAKAEHARADQLEDRLAALEATVATLTEGTP